MSNLPAKRSGSNAAANAIAVYDRSTELAWDDPRRLEKSMRGPFWIGASVLFVFVGVLGFWSATAPLSGGAIAPGVIAPEGSRRTVQHYEGGIVRRVWAIEGKQVKKGDPLLILADVSHQAKHQTLISKRHALLAKKARLLAERDNAEHIKFPDELKKSRSVAEQIASQTLVFHARKQDLEARKNVLRQRLKQLSAQIEGHKALSDSQRTQLAIIQQELDIKDKLRVKGYVRLPDTLRLRRMVAEQTGRIGELRANVQSAQQKQLETRLELKALETKRAARISVEFDEVSNELRDVTENLRASQDVLKRSIVRAPVTGRIANLGVKTIGGVVRRGQDILDIIPSEERLLVEARVSPLDIDVVKEGLIAQVNLTAFAGQNAPRIMGTVLMVSADREEGKNSGDKPFYLAKVVVERSELEKIGSNIRLAPGMPADVMIVTGDRTMLNYLLQPFRDALYRSFREAA